MYEKIASTRIFGLKKPFEIHIPSAKEIQIETQNKNMSNKEETTLYDGFEFQYRQAYYSPCVLLIRTAYRNFLEVNRKPMS